MISPRLPAKVPAQASADCLPRPRHILGGSATRQILHTQKPVTPLRANIQPTKQGGKEIAPMHSAAGCGYASAAHASALWGRSKARRKTARLKLLYASLFIFQSCSSIATAAFAAACSASFLLRPSPAPSVSPFRHTSISKSLAWSGPLSVIR